MMKRKKKITFKNIDEMLVFIREMNRKGREALEKFDTKVIQEEKAYDALSVDFAMEHLNEKKLEQSLKDLKEFYQMQSKVNKYFLDYIKKNKIK